MDRERVRITAQVYGLRGRAWLRTVVQVAGVVLLLLGAYNLVLADHFVWGAMVPTYREILGSVITYREDIFADLALMVVGATVAWFV